MMARQSSKRLLRERRLELTPTPRQIIVGWTIVSVFVSACVWAVYLVCSSWYGPGIVFLVLCLICWQGTILRNQRFARLVAARNSATICDFARSFDCRKTDTVLIRAVYETVQEKMGPPLVPLRAEDRLLDDLELDEEDLDEIFIDAAKLCNLSIVSTESNPLYDKVITVRDVVEFLRHQPTLQTTV
jgi:hypothetical protein